MKIQSHRVWYPQYVQLKHFAILTDIVYITDDLQHISAASEIGFG